MGVLILKPIGTPDRAFSKSVTGFGQQWFDKLTTNEKHTSVRPEGVEGLLFADSAKALRGGAYRRGGRARLLGPRATLRS